MMQDEQRYLFDTFGYIVVPDVLTSAQIESLRTTIQHPTEQWDPEHAHDAPLHWHRIWRDLLDLPTLSPMLEQLIGNPNLLAARQASGREALPTFRLDHINVHTHVKQGFAGGMLHGGGGVNGAYTYHDGRICNGLLAVSFELYDTHPNGGGFACIPGSHKANVTLPNAWRDLSQGVHGCVTRVAAVPGDAIVFSEALTHGTLPWTVDAKRSTVFYKFSPHGSSWAASYFDPEDYRAYADVDDRKLAILEPPNARYRGRPTKPRRIEARAERRT